MAKAFFIGYIWPEPKTTAAGSRMVQLLETFKTWGYEVIFATTAQKTIYSTNLDVLGITTVTILLNNSSFDTYIKNLQPDIVVFDRFMVEEQFGWRVAEFAPKALRILNTEDLHSLRLTRESCLKNKTDFHNDVWKSNDITKREIASIYRSDVTLLISSLETMLLQAVFDIPLSLLFTLPFIEQPLTSAQSNKLPKFKERTNFVFVGNGKHAPNIDAIKFLKNTIWPLIRKELRSAKLYVYGAYLPQQIIEMNNPKEGFFVMGWIDDLDKVMQQAKINLVPLRFGAGLKGKIFKAMRNGTPNITTSIGEEGLENLNLLNVEDAPEDFASKAINLYKNESSWLVSQKNDKQILESFTKQSLESHLFKHMETLLKNIETHRSANFIGAMLQHQTMASTKFMSKWIQEKIAKNNFSE